MKRINTDRLLRRIIQYVVGVSCIAFGIVLIKRTLWGVPPVSAIPDAAAAVTPLSIGNCVTLFCILCVITMMIINRKITVRALLTIPVSIGFGYLVDFFMWLWHPEPGIFLNCLFLLAGITVQGFGISAVAGSDMIFPAPDELNRIIVKVFNKKLANVKIFMDVLYVVIAILINLLTLHSVVSIGISSIISAVLTGQFIRLFTRFLPGLQLPPVLNKK